MTRDFPAGNYRFIPAVFQYSSGAAADPGFEIERVRFDRLLPLAEGFAQHREIYPGGGAAADFVLRLRIALAGGVYRGRLSEHSTSITSRRWREWGLFDGTTNPVARSNVCPEIDPPAEPSFLCVLLHAAEATARTPSFVIAGGAEARGGSGSYPERIVRYRDLSPEGLKEKVRFTRRRNAKPPRRVRLRLERHHGGAGLHRARLPSRCWPMKWSAAARRVPA